VVGIIFTLNIEYAPFLNKYTDILIKEGIEFEVIYWERLETDITCEWPSIVYKKRGKLGDSKIIKLISFFKYRLFLIKTLKNKKYDKLIVLTTLAGMIIFDLLLFKFRDRYIFDIRDYTFEKNYLFRFLENFIIKNSRFTAISSNGFKEFLPKSDKYIVSHNIILDEIENVSKRNIQNMPIFNLVFIGAVRHLKIDIQLIDLFGNDDRFKIYFHGYGIGYDNLNKYVGSNFTNVFLTGKYNRKDKPKLLKNASVILSYYSKDNYANLFALPNKYYDALIYNIPLWANPEVYVGKRAIKAGVGIDILLDSSSPERIYNYLIQLNYKKFKVNCRNELKNILNEDVFFINGVNKFIRE